MNYILPKFIISNKEWNEEYAESGIYGDAAILILETPLQLNHAVSNICLPSRGVIVPDKTYWNGFKINIDFFSFYRYRHQISDYD